MDINQIKLIMLNEYEKQVNKLFDKFYKNDISINDFVVNFNRMINNWDSTRVDIKNHGQASNTIKLLEYGKNVNVSFPDWFCDGSGHGCKLEWHNTDLNFMFSCSNEGNLKIVLRGVDFRDIGGNRIPVYTNFKKMMVNEKIDFEGNELVWHNEPYIFEKQCEDNEVIYVDLKFETIFDYFPQLNTHLSEDITYNEIQLTDRNIAQFIQLEKVLLKKGELHV